MNKKTWHIHIQGQVQGVGFRPFVYKQAQLYDLNGWVNNTVDGVHVEFNSGKETASKFHESLIKDAPRLSRITSHKLKKIEAKKFNDFRIIQSESKGKRNLLITPDFAMCDDCRKELFDDKDRRYKYPFITCTLCGPRYSIIEKLPYDRETTTMERFTMCEKCSDEYEHPLDRRYYSQTNSCDQCGIEMALYDSEKNLISKENREIIEQIAGLWSKGKIVAIKGIGGYLLTCDASNCQAIEELRKRKHRPAKPFALMYPDLNRLEKDVNLRDIEKDALESSVFPIVLLNVRNDRSLICVEQIAPGLDQIGVMLPYTPLYDLLLNHFDKPVIATSGNISHSPIVFSDEKAFTDLLQISDAILINNRKIVVPQDDSVIKFTAGHQKKIIYRRSRGLAPSYINKDLENPEETILATGAMLKNTFTYLNQKNIYISQYLGNLDHFDTEQNYRHTLNHFFNLFGKKPERILADKHPGYFSTRIAEELSEELGVPLKKYQHHVAHFGAVLGEQNLLESIEPVLGIIWDGTGLGNDGQIWGGEFFVYDNYEFKRQHHLDYFDFITGDKMPKEPRISALTVSNGCNGADELLRNKFTEVEWKNYHTLLNKPGNLKTSSVGRLFDAVASLLDIKDYNSFEGESAMLLEKFATDFFRKNKPKVTDSYLSEYQSGNVPTKLLLQKIIDDVYKDVEKGEIAFKFHFTLVDAIKKAANSLSINRISFSGGVFQNSLLIDLILDYLSDDFQLYFHKELSPNDENISFGQLMCYKVDLLRLLIFDS